LAWLEACRDSRSGLKSGCGNISLATLTLVLQTDIGMQYIEPRRRAVKRG
jgi:hypothetical protein